MVITSMPTLPGYLTVEATASRFGQSAQWVRQLCREGRLAGAVKVGGVYFVPVATVKSWKKRPVMKKRGRPKKGD